MLSRTARALLRPRAALHSPVPCVATLRVVARAAGTSPSPTWSAPPVRLSPLERVLKVTESAFEALRDPLRDDMVGIVAETTGDTALRVMHEKMMDHPVGRRLLAEKRRVRTEEIEAMGLDQLPRGTFGREYWEYMNSNGFDPDGRREVQFVEDPELRYVLQRYREIHDYLHVMSGLPPTVFAEVVLKWFELVQTGLPLCALGGIMGPVKVEPRDRLKMVTEFIPWAARAGRTAHFVLNVDWESHFADKVEDLRRKYNFPAAPPIH